MVRTRRRQRGLSVAATALPSAVAVAAVSAISKADDLQLTHASSICLTRQVLSNDDKCHLRLYEQEVSLKPKIWVSQTNPAV